MHEPRSTVLDRISPRDRELLFDRSARRRLAAEEPLVHAVDRATRVHLVSSGVLKLVGRDFEGNQTILGLCVPGDLAGTVAALDPGPQPYDYVAATPVTVVGFDTALLHDVLARNPGAALALAGVLARRVRWLCDATQERTSAHVPARLAGRLLDLVELMGQVHDGYVELELPFPQRDLGGLAGMCRESACKTLRRWKSQGTLDYEGRTLRIRRPDVLRGIKCAGRAAEPSP